MARFLIDAQLPPGLAARLVDAGHWASHVNDLGLGGGSDAEVSATAEALDAILVSKDEDFVSLIRAGAFSGPLLWIRLGNTSNRHLWFVLEPLVDEIVRAFGSGETLIEVR